MITKPLVSIVIPAYNDEEHIATALESCLAQTLRDIEVIVVDDASTDGTTHVVDRFVDRDIRVRLLRQPENASALQARRAGVMAARADHLLFLDGDDELAPAAAELTLERARAQNTDLLQFGVDVVRMDGTTGGRFESRLQPRHDRLEGDEVLRALFPEGEPAQGQLWRYLFRTEILRDVYELVPDELVLPRVNDLPIMFLTAARARRFASVPDRLYRYHFGQGSSGHKLQSLEKVTFYASGISSIDAIGDIVTSVASRNSDGGRVLDAYRSVREFIVGYTTSYVAQHTPDDLLETAFAHLRTRASFPDIVRAVARHFPASLDVLAANSGQVDLGTRSIRNVLITTSALRTGGVSGVIRAQAQLLTDAGYAVTVLTHEASAPIGVPAVEQVELAPGDLADQLAAFVAVCRDRDIDVVIDHSILYSLVWPTFALAARAEGIATIGWAHNFALRPVLLGLKRLDFQTRHLPALATFVVLSRLDVAFWKLRGMPRTVFLPNPPSDIFRSEGRRSSPKAAPIDRRAELIWWGRLEERTKRPSELVAVAHHLAKRGIDFRLRVIGPDWNDLTREDLEAMAADAGVESQVHVIGSLTGDDLRSAIESADVFVSTSVIEGYPLTLPEAQSRGLPVAMYDLPWLALLEENPGVVTTAQGDSAALADAITAIISDERAFSRLSAGSLEAAERVATEDFTALYSSLLAGELQTDRSPTPAVEDSQRLIDLTIAFAEDFTQKSAAPRRGAPNAGAPVGPSDRSESSDTPLFERLSPIASRIVDRAPALRPVAQKVKHRLLRR